MKLKDIIFILALTLANAQLCISQCLTINFIKNPSLEEFSCCPQHLSKISCANFWTNPLSPASTSDYFNTCVIDSLVDLTLIYYLNHAHFGNGFAGIICCQNSPVFYPPYREYIQGNIVEPLVADKCYYAEFWVLPFNYFPMANTYSAIDAIGLYFSDTLPTLNLPQPIFVVPQISNNKGNIIFDTANWSKISGFFIANGGEKYFTAGTFIEDSAISKLYYNTTSPNVAYYFFDNFSLCPCEDTIPQKEPPPVVFIPNMFSPNADGHNDILYVRGQNITGLLLQIYNRWGEQVFESHELAQGWDGTHKGKKCADGVYYYVAEIMFSNGETVSRKGNVTLVR